jgi:ParB-like chromosome segregation protein Spo0J
VRRHPRGKYQLFPDHSAEQFAALKEDIKLRGIQVPIDVDENGDLLDGHHRLRAYEELRAEGRRVPSYKRHVLRFATEDEKRAHVYRVNLLRRQLDLSQRREVLAALRKKGMSFREISDLTGMPKSTVATSLAGVPDGTPGRVRGKDGKEYPALQLRRPTVIAAANDKEEQRAIAALREMGDGAPPRALRLQRAEHKVRQTRLAAPKVPTGESVAGVRWRIDCVDLRDLKIRSGSVDLIVSDPPYTNAGLPMFSELSQFAARVLKPGRLCICYVGKLALPDEIERLSTHLTYVWLGSIYQPGRHTAFNGLRIHAAHRPFLIFARGKYKPDKWLLDTIESRAVPDKSLHPWQQAEGPISKLIEMGSRPGGLVVDPFIGSGTTGAMAVRLGRRFVGCDVDPEAVATATKRLRSEEAALRR